MNRRRRSTDHVSHERWLVSYADFITLLFAFFVVLFASSQVDKHKVVQLSAAIQEAFRQMGVFQNPGAGVAVVGPDSLHGARGEPANLTVAPPASGMDALKKQVADALGPELERHEVVLKIKPDGLVVSLREIGFFDSGSAELRPGSEAAVQRLADVLRAQPNYIRIEGHTDNVPIHNSHFASNWELSTARATEMIRLFITQYGFPSLRLSAAGYAEFHPVADNDSGDGRAQNRRVDIVILTTAPPQPTPVAGQSP